MIAVLIPASNEEALIDRCLAAVLASDPVPAPVEVVVAANGCRDATVTKARAFTDRIAARGWSLTVLDLPAIGKPGALNAADAATRAGTRVYLDADVTVSPPLLAQLAGALDRSDPSYASGTVRITAGKSPFSRLYARTWARVPFMARGVPGCGLFAVNAAGRARWGDFPSIISDDTFVRLQFTPTERVGVPATYDWPIAEGLRNLLRVRRRQDEGVAEIARLFPDLLANDDKARLGPSGTLRLALSAPLSFAAYAAVGIGVRLMPAATDWSRGR
jgi:glycosyltransferase involved in cell wall biosynthesis